MEHLMGRRYEGFCWRALLVCAGLQLVFSSPTGAANSDPRPAYRTPPDAIAQLIDSPSTALVSASPGRKWIVLEYRKGRSTMSDLLQPTLGLAGWTVDVNANRRFYPSIRPIERLSLLDASTGEETRLAIPAGDLGNVEWSPDGLRFAFMRAGLRDTELWMGDVASKVAHKVPNVRLNAARVAGALGNNLPCHWERTGRVVLYCLLVPDARGDPPQRGSFEAPSIQDTAERPSAKSSMSIRVEGRLQNPYDEALYDYYMTSQPAVVDPVGGRVRFIGRSGVYDRFEPSPDGKYFLSIRIDRPYSYQTTDSQFPRTIEIVDVTGNLVRKIAQKPQDISGNSANGWVEAGPRQFFWRPSAAATLAYYQALDGGDPNQKADQHDSLLLLQAPFDGAPLELFRSASRMGFYPVRSLWGRSGLVLLEEYDWTSHLRRTWELNADHLKIRPELLLSYNADDVYGDPGEFMTVLGPKTGREWGAEILVNDGVLLQDGDCAYLRGTGASPLGDRPFLDCYNLRTHRKVRLFKSSAGVLEHVVSALDPAARNLLVSFETPTVPPNFRIDDRVSGHSRVLTNFSDPIPFITRAGHQHLLYTRRDGLELSGDFYVSDGSLDKKPAPLVIYAYPSDYVTASGAQQRRGSPNAFRGTDLALSPLPLLTQGYAVFEAAMPIVGGSRAYDSVSRQLSDNATAAINKLVELGLADRSRIGIVGHSWGAFMVADLLATTRLFSAGVALSGLYNFSLTPFGFQHEQRSYWQAPELYEQISPFRHADGIAAPLLLIHGEKDESLGASVIQSTRLFEALYGLGAQSRLVVLPHELHNPVAKESVLHIQWEMLRWFDMYLKGSAPP